MQYRNLGKSGVQVSVIGLGTNRFGSPQMPQAEVSRVINAAADMGINFLDTANLYQDGRSEETIGEALRGKRDRFILATKFSGKIGDGPNDRGMSRYHLMQSIHASLDRLQTDVIDLLYVHFYDETTPLEETLRALDDLVRAGKVRYIGSSNFSAWRLAQANLLSDFRGWSPFIVSQVHYHMLERKVETEMLPCCRDLGLGLIPYFPLAGGFLTGKYRRGQPAPVGSRGESNPYVQSYMTEANYTLVENLGAWAEARGHTLGDLAQAWLLSHPEVSSVISGATRLDQVQHNVRAADWSLTDEEVAAVESMLRGDPVPGIG